MLVFFSNGAGGPSLARRERLAATLTRTISRSEHVHIAIGLGTVVLDPLYQGDHQWDTEKFIRSYPGLLCVVEVPCDPRPVKTNPKRRSVVASLIRWATWNLWPTTNCLTVAVNALRDAGVYIPWGIRTPEELRLFLIARYPYERLEPHRTGSGGRENGDAASRTHVPCGSTVPDRCDIPGVRGTIGVCGGCAGSHRDPAVGHP